MLFALHARLRVQRAPGIPHAFVFEADELAQPGQIAPRDRGVVSVSILRRGGGYTLAERLQPGFDLRAARLQERWQRQFFPKGFHRLVGGKARSVGRNLEQDAVGLAKI